jgi:hypothetical protein
VDILWADVVEVLDGSTFKAKITHYGENNTRKYPVSQSVRIHGTKAPHPSTTAGELAHHRLTQQISRRHVRLVVEETDPQGNLICYVRLAQRKAA